MRLGLFRRLSICCWIENRIHEPHFGQHFKYNITEVKESAGLKPGISVSFGYKMLLYKQIREVNLYTSNQFWGVVGGLLYLLVGIYSLVLAALGSYGMDAESTGGMMGYGSEYKTVDQSGGGGIPSGDGGNPYEVPSRPTVDPSTQPGSSGGYGTL